MGHANKNLEGYEECQRSNFTTWLEFTKEKIDWGYNIGENPNRDDQTS